MDMGEALPEGHFVRTDPRKGFTLEDAARVRAMLATQEEKGRGP